MRDRIREIAVQNGRSMNAEIIHRLESTLEPEFEMISKLTKLNIQTLTEAGDSKIDFIGLLEEMKQSASNASALSSILLAIANSHDLPPPDISNPPDEPPLPPLEPEGE